MWRLTKTLKSRRASQKDRKIRMGFHRLPPRPKTGRAAQPWTAGPPALSRPGKKWPSLGLPSNRRIQNDRKIKGGFSKRPENGVGVLTLLNVAADKDRKIKAGFSKRPENQDGLPSASTAAQDWARGAALDRWASSLEPAWQKMAQSWAAFEPPRSE